MKTSLLIIALLISCHFLAADKQLKSKPFYSLRFEIFNKHFAQLKQRILDLRKRIQEKLDAKTELERNAFEKYILPRANGTSLLKDFYAGRYSQRK